MAHRLVDLWRRDGQSEDTVKRTAMRPTTANLKGDSMMTAEPLHEEKLVHRAENFKFRRVEARPRAEPESTCVGL